MSMTLAEEWLKSHFFYVDGCYISRSAHYWPQLIVVNQAMSWFAEAKILNYERDVPTLVKLGCSAFILLSAKACL